MLLTDVLMALVQNTPPNYATSEIDIKMPSSAHSFRLIYNSLLHGFPLPPDVSSQEDALLILVALLADIVYYQSAFQPHIVREESGVGPKSHVPLSSSSEHVRLIESLGAALSRWNRYFHQSSSGDILVLYRLARMRLLAPAMVTYRGSIAMYGRQMGEPSERTISLAWEILDLTESVLDNNTQRMSMWLPMAIFASAVVVWKGLMHSKDSMGRHGRLRMLSLFQEKLSQLPWPCCHRMIADLDYLSNISRTE